MSQQVKGQLVTCVIDCFLKAAENWLSLRAVVFFHVEQILDAVLQHMGCKVEEEWVEYLLVTYMRSVIFVDDFVDPLRHFFLHLVEIYGLDCFLLFAFLPIFDLPDFSLELLFVDKHVRTLAPILTCLGKNFCLIIIQISSSKAVFLNILAQTVSHLFVIELSPV